MYPNMEKMPVPDPQQPYDPPPPYNVQDQALQGSAPPAPAGPAQAQPPVQQGKKFNNGPININTCNYTRAN